MNARPVVLITNLLLLSACAVGPDFRHPPIPPSANATFIGGTVAGVDAAAETSAPWWELYHDPVLEGLIDQALTANTDIRVALGNLDKARAQLRGARAARLPRTTVAGSVTDQRVPNWQVLPGVAEQQFWSVDAGLNISYEIDLFGRVRRETQAALQDAWSVQADAEAVRVAVVSDLARAYIDATASSEQIAVAEQTVALLYRSVKVTTARFKVGLAQQLDVVRITELREQRQATLPTLRAQREAALFAIAALVGRTPHDLPGEVLTQTHLPHLTSPIPIGDGRALISRRPDVRAAEHRLAADTARIGVATADLYPRISFGGSVGSTSDMLNPPFGTGPFRWAFGPAISWSFPNIEPVRARIAGARAETRSALARFDGTVLTALRETETALSAYGHELERHSALASARDAAERAARVSLDRQRQGTIDFLSLLDAQRTLADAQAELVASDARIGFAQVDLFRALGGGWQTQPAVSAR